MSFISYIRIKWLPITLICSFILLAASASTFAYIHSQNQRKKLYIEANNSNQQETQSEKADSSSPSTSTSSTINTAPASPKTTPGKSVVPSIDPCVEIDSFNDPTYVQSVADVHQTTTQYVNQALAKSGGIYTPDTINTINADYANANNALNDIWQSYLQAIKQCTPLMTAPVLYSPIPQQ